jgi:hypothetical protein
MPDDNRRKTENGGGGMKFLPSRQPTREVSPRRSGYPDKAFYLHLPRASPLFRRSLTRSVASHTRRLALRLDPKAVTFDHERWEDMKMDAKGFVAARGVAVRDLVLAPGRSAVLKLVGAETGNNIILFDETAPAGIETTFYRHRDSD